MHFIAHAVLEQRAQATVSEARREDCVPAGAAFPPEERAGDFPAGGHSFLIFHLQWEEVDAFTHATHCGGSEDDRFAGTEGDRAACLGSQLTGLKRESLISNGG